MTSAGRVQTLLTYAKAQERRAMLPDKFFRRLFPAGHETMCLATITYAYAQLCSMRYYFYY